MSDIQKYPDKNSLSQAAAEIFAQVARAAVAARGRFLVALSGGGSPETLFHILCHPPYDTAVPWQRTHLFWGDERLVPPDEPGSNYGQLVKIWGDKLFIPEANYHRFLGEADPETAVQKALILLKQFAEPGQRWPQFDLALLGMGADGHTASLFPGPIPRTEMDAPVMAVTADYEGRPANRLTMTPLVFNEAHHLLFLVMGEKKADAVTAVLGPNPDPIKWPAARVQPASGSLVWLLDEAAASRLPS